jgi:aminotransferase
MSERFVLPYLRFIDPPLYRRIIEKASTIEGVMTLLGGDPDFDTPAHIRNAAVQAIEEGWTHYPPMGGMADLKGAIAEYHTRYGTDWSGDEEVVVTPGSTPSLFLSFVGTLDRGDEIILFEPYYMGYKPVIDYMDLKFSSVNLEEDIGFHFDLEDLKEKVSDKTKMIVICSPNNPTGTVFSKGELDGIADIAQDEDLLVLSDEIYEQFVFDDNEHYSIASFPGMRERTIVILSFSKTFAMTGWRLGTLLADKGIVRSFRRIPIGGRPATFIQKAGVAALKGPWGEVDEFREEYKRRRDFMVERLNNIPGIECQSPEGAFYLFPTFEEVGEKSIEFCEGLLNEQKLATVPGIEFGEKGEYHMRIPLIRPIEYLSKCSEAIENYVETK